MSCRQLLEKLNRRSTPIFPKFNRISKICLFLLITVSAILLTKQILAKNSIQDFQNAIDEGNNGQSWVYNSFDANINTMREAIGGTIPFDATGKPILEGYMPGGIIGITNNMIASLYNPPASGIQYLAQMKDNFLGKPAYAQGTGFTGLQPLLLIWRTFRNAIYILSALVFIILGIMIMLRVKISQQAVITIQTAIPGLITTLILVTFSYAIAGLLIDAMNFVQAMVITLLFNGLGKHLNEPLFQGTASFNWTFERLNTPGFSDSWWLSYHLISSLVGWIITVGIVGGILTSLFAGVTGWAFAIGGGIALLIILIIITWMLIKFFFGLVKCYLNVILQIIFAPILIGLGAFPNFKIGFGSWILDLIANLSVFPLCLIYLIILNLLIGSTDKLWSPQIISSFSFGGPGFLIGIAGFFLLPKLPELIPQVIFQLKPSPFGKAIGEELKVPRFVKGGAKFATGQAGTYVGTKFGGEEGKDWKKKDKGEKAATVFKNATDFITRK